MSHNNKNNKKEILFVFNLFFFFYRTDHKCENINVFFLIKS